MNGTHEASQAEELLRAGQLKIRGRYAAETGTVLEVESDEPCAGRQFVVERDDGLHMGLRLELPEGAPLRGQAPQAASVMQALGEITYALGREGLYAQFSAGRSGVDAITLAAHLCRGVSAQTMRNRLQALRQAAARIAGALACTPAGPGRSLVPALRAAPTAASAPAGGARVYLSATFDETARAQIQTRSERLRQRQGRPITAADEPPQYDVRTQGPQRAFPDALLGSERFRAC